MAQKRGTCVLSGGSSDGLAKSIADKIGAELITTEVRVFSDGESKMRLGGGTAGYERAVIVQSLHPPVDTNLFRALCLISRISEDTKDVTAVIPYVGYARQDAEFLPGEIISAKVLGRMLRSAGASRIVVVDIHSERGLALLGARSTTNVSAIPALARHFDGAKLERPVAVSPDKGGARRAETVRVGDGVRPAGARKVKGQEDGGRKHKDQEGRGPWRAGTPL